MAYQVHFGSAFAIDGFGFVGKGELAIDGEEVQLSGRRHWSALARVGVFLAIFLPLYIASRADILGILLAYVAFAVVHYACASRGSVELSTSQVTQVTRKGRRITFRAPLEPGGKLRRSLFHARTEQYALEIESALEPQ